jgi:hypothetical protein
MAFLNLRLGRNFFPHFIWNHIVELKSGGDHGLIFIILIIEIIFLQVHYLFMLNLLLFTTTNGTFILTLHGLIGSLPLRIYF